MPYFISLRVFSSLLFHYRVPSSGDLSLNQHNFVRERERGNDIDGYAIEIETLDTSFIQAILAITMK